MCTVSARRTVAIADGVWAPCQVGGGLGGAPALYRGFTRRGRDDDGSAAIAQQERPVLMLMAAGASKTLLPTSRCVQLPEAPLHRPEQARYGCCTANPSIARAPRPSSTWPWRPFTLTLAVRSRIHRLPAGLPACTSPLVRPAIPDPGTLASADGAQNSTRAGVQGGGWPREALAVLRLFHGRLHLGAPTACPSAPTRTARGPALSRR